MIKIINKVINTDINKELENINIFLEDKTSLPEYIENTMESYRGLPAVKDEHNQIEMTYHEVLDNIKWIASAMQVSGIQKGDFVTFLSENNGKHFIFNQGIMKAGAVSVLRGAETEKSELKYILEHSESKAVILSDYKLLTKFHNYFKDSNYIKFIVIIFDKSENLNNDLNIPVYSFEEFINLGKNHVFVNPNLTVNDNAEMLYTSGTTGFYYKDEESTKKIIDAEGWFNTGDLGWLTSDNHLVLVGRLKETIVLSNGENVEPLPIEEACLGSEFIDQIVLVGQDKNSIGALVVPTQEALQKCGLVLNDLKKGVNLSIKNPNLRELIKKEIDSYIKNKPNLKPFEKIKKFEILKESFNQENGLLSKTGKTKRNNIFNEYQEIIAKMFSDRDC